MKKKKKNTAKPTRETISIEQLHRLSFCNSERLPRAVENNSRRLEWVGIGWVDTGKADGTEVLVIE